MALRLGALVTFAENLASAPSTHVAAHNALKLEFLGKFTPSPGLCRHIQVPYVKVKCSHTFPKKKKSSKKEIQKLIVRFVPRLNVQV